MTRIVCLCVDGAGAQGDILKATKDAFGWCGIALDRKHYKYSKSLVVPMADYSKKIRALVKNNGGDPGALELLIVGKSFGAAKMYNLLYKKIDYLEQFSKVAVTLVDSHEPGAPGDKGDKNKWYDCVYFSGGTYRLKWWADKWGLPGDQSNDSAKLRFFVTYQRNKWPRGYSMNSPYKRVNLTRKNVKCLIDDKKELANHDNIAWCDKTVELLVEAIEFLKVD